MSLITREHLESKNPDEKGTKYQQISSFYLALSTNNNEVILLVNWECGMMSVISDSALSNTLWTYLETTSGSILFFTNKKKF